MSGEGRPSDSARFLIVRLGALGDIVHAVPVAAALRRAFPAATIDWLVSTRHREFLEFVTGLDDRLAVRDRGRSGEGLSVTAMIGKLRKRHYDVVFDLQGLIKSATFARSTGAGRVIGFASRHVREKLACTFYTETYEPGGGGFRDAASAHVVAKNLGMLSMVGAETRAIEFPIATVDSPVAGALAARAAGRYAVLNPGAAWPNKRWPASRFAAVARALRERHRIASIITWGPGEESLAENVVQDAPGAAILAPRTSLGDLIALLRGASLMVSGDTGPTHVAAALAVPIVGLYGPTRPSRNGPWSPADLVVSRDAECECHYLRHCRRERMCLLDIDAAEVIDAVDRRLAAA